VQPIYSRVLTRSSGSLDPGKARTADSSRFNRWRRRSGGPSSLAGFSRLSGLFHSINRSCRSRSANLATPISEVFDHCCWPGSFQAGPAPAAYTVCIYFLGQTQSRSRFRLLDGSAYAVFFSIDALILPPSNGRRLRLRHCPSAAAIRCFLRGADCGFLAAAPISRPGHPAPPDVKKRRGNLRLLMPRHGCDPARTGARPRALVAPAALFWVLSIATMQSSPSGAFWSASAAAKRPCPMSYLSTGIGSALGRTSWCTAPCRYRRALRSTTAL